ncbi:MAG: U32 family peptidase [Lachnospiraceae bacterium]|nr:U32 family peptidase [Lachnospiraceae bacterium]
MRKTEILMPAGSLEVLKTDIRYGADAVYLGGDAFGLRAGAKNFSLEEMKEGIRLAHAANVKVYVTANILARDEDIDDAEGYFEELRSIGPDAVLIADPGMFMTARLVMPEMELHISTQANNTNSATFNFWYGLGAKRVVCARELSLAEIKRIRKSIPEDAEIEAFVHGAMCISYSGRCLLSTFMTGREANKGMCTHPCRWKYTLMEEKRPGEYFPVYENDRGTYIFNSRDLCMIEHIPELIETGIDSLKVEGRMKTALYAATVARAYRMAVDDFKKDPELYKQNLPVYTSELEKGTYRDYTTGFFFGRPTQEGQIYDNNTYKKTYTYLGYPEEFTKEGLALITQKNKFSVGDTIEIMKPDGRNISVSIDRMFSENMEEIESCPHPGQRFLIDLKGAAQTGDILRKEDN